MKSIFKRSIALLYLSACVTVATSQQVQPPPVGYAYIGETRVLNHAVRGNLAAGESLISGFVVSDASTATVLLRAAGPALTPLGIQGAMLNPRLQLFDAAGRVVVENDDWVSSSVPVTSIGVPSVALASINANAFAWTPGSRDAAVVVNLASGAYTLVVSGASNADAGVVVGEVYHLPLIELSAVAAARGDRPSSKLVNISARGRIADSGAMIAGFTVGSVPALGVVVSTIAVGEVPPKIDAPSKRFLIRVVGPTLSEFGLTATVANPTLEVARTDGAVIQTNDDWDADPTAAAAILEATSAAGAFPLRPGSRDAAVLVTIPEGLYSVIARGANNGVGTALIEIYELQD